MDVLDQIITECGIGLDEWEREQSRRQILTLVEEVMQGTVWVSKDIEAALMARMADIDELLSGQLNAIMHAPEFQTLEAAWRGLHYLVAQTETGPLLKIRVLNVSQKELHRDQERATDFSHSALFKKVHDDIYGTCGEEPFGVLLGDYAFGNNLQDLALLENLAHVAAASHAPFLAAAAPGLLGLGSFTDLPSRPDFTKKFRTVDHFYLKWQSFRESEDSCYVGLTLPHILMRLPYGPDTVPTETFNFKEDIDGTDHSKYLWGNAAYALGSRLTASFATYGWCAAITGVDAGGRVDGLPICVYCTDYGEVAMKSPVEVFIYPEQEDALSRAGLIALLPAKGTDFAWFHATPSCQKPKTYDSYAQNCSVRLSVRLPYIFAASRFVHYMRVILRNRADYGLALSSDLQGWLNKWIQRYVMPLDLSEGEASLERRAQYPLKWAYIEVRKLPDQAGYQVVGWLRPQFQLAEVLFPLRVSWYLPSTGVRGGMTAAYLEAIKDTFDKKYAAWELALPAQSLRAGSSGSITNKGWTINYLYGIEQGEVFLEYFATHRMTGDTLNRIYADGREEVIGEAPRRSAGGAAASGSGVRAAGFDGDEGNGVQVGQ